MQSTKVSQTEEERKSRCKMDKNTLERFLLLSEAKPVSAKTLKSLFRAITEPVLESGEKGLVLLRIKDDNGIKGVITRLNFSENLEIVDFSERCAQKKDIWVSSEFVLILSSRYSAFLLWDFEGNDFTPVYMSVNSKLINEPFEVIAENSEKDLRGALEEFKPDRRENLSLNSAFSKLCEALENAQEENALKTLEQKTLETNAKEALQSKYNEKKVRECIHEIRNQLSILDIYAALVEKKSGLSEEAKTIKKAVSLINSELSGLKGLQNINLQEKDLNNLVEEAVKLTKALGKVNYESTSQLSVFADEDKFIAVMVNLIKNAIEADGEVWIKVSKNERNEGVVTVENNGKPIEDSDAPKIFDEGFTTKDKGSGIGLHLCKTTLAAMLCKIKLLKSDEKSTVFEICVPLL